MGRSIWLVLSLMSIMNIVAILVLAGWLQATNRLSGERLQEVRSIFARSVAQQEYDDDQDAKEAARQAEIDEAEARVGTTPLSSEQRLSIVSEYEKVRRAELERMQEETRRLRQTLAAERDDLEWEKVKFNERKSAFEEMRAEIIRREDDEQFAKSVAMYETIKANQSAEMMMELVNQGKTDEVVAYLDAMKPRSAAKVIAEVQKAETQLAAELLERLKVYGLIPSTDEELPNADP